jgi:hypothetical protein
MSDSVEVRTADTTGAPAPRSSHGAIPDGNTPSPSPTRDSLPAMSNWKRILLFGGAAGAGAVVAIALIATGFYYLSHRVKPWNSRAVTAEYDNLRTEGPDHTFVFAFTLVNHTDQDFHLDGQSDHLKVAARLRSENSLSFDEGAAFMGLDYPIYVPEHGRTRMTVHFKIPYVSSDPVDPSNGSDDERKDWETKVSRFVTDHYENLSGFTILDTTSRYEIDLPSGWEERSKDSLSK